MTSSFFEELAARGHEVAVFVYNIEEHRIENGVKVYSLKETSPDLLPRPDVMYAHIGMSKSAVQYGYQLNIPVVGIIHNTLPATYIDLKKHKSNINLLIFNSEFTKQSSHGYDGVVMHSLLDTERYRTVRKGAKYIMIPSLSEDKGGALFEELARRLPQYDFLGLNGPYNDQLNPVGKNITTLPTVRHEDINSVFAQTKIMLAPSAYESWGRAAAEAMCSGIPVIASRAGGLVECLGNAGYNLDLEDIDAWCSTIRNLMDDGHMYTEQSVLANVRAMDIERQSKDELMWTIKAMEDLCNK